VESADVAGHFYARCEGARRLEEIEAALFETAAQKGFPHVSYLCGDSAAQPKSGILLTNFPREWRRHYLERRYYRIDPLISLVHRAIDPFVWSDPLVRARMSPKQLQMLDEAKEFRLGDGYAVPLHSSIHVRASCFFASEFGDLDPESCRAMRHVSVIAHEYIARFTRLSDPRGEAPPLSERERACLNLYAQGFDDAEIGGALGIRVPTVRRHFEQAKRRLGVASRPEALVRALLTRQIAA